MTQPFATSPTSPGEGSGSGSGSSRPSPPPGARRRRMRPGLGELLVAVACFVVLCGAALSRPAKLLEPDDYAYRASIVALSEGHLVLSDEQYQDLRDRLQVSDRDAGRNGAGGLQDRRAAIMGIVQWTQLADGRWVSEKNPGYPFFAVPFQLLGILRAAPLFYGALGCFALFVGARRWLGAWGGTWAVGLFCSSGAAMAFAWRAWMPTFSGAALIAAGAGALLWAALAGDAGARRRTVAGLLGFLALEGAMLIRYTDAVAPSRWPSQPCSSCGASHRGVSRAGRCHGGSALWQVPRCSSSPGTRSYTAARSRPATPRGSSPSASARSTGTSRTCPGI